MTSADTPAPGRCRVRTALTAAITAAVTLTACTTGAEAPEQTADQDTGQDPGQNSGQDSGQDAAAVEDLDREPRASDEELPAADTSDLQVPTQFDQLVTVEPAWDLPVQRGEDVFLSAQETDTALVFHAVDSAGTVLWTAERPLACAGFVVTRDADGRDLAVLTDAESSDADSSADGVSVVTASAYDLRTGEPAWGPVEVPGPHVGPGLVFEAPPEGFMGDAGSTIVLDPSKGDVVDEGPGRVLGEYDGTIVRVEDDAVTGTSGADDGWETPLAEFDGDASSLEAHPAVGADGLVLLDTGDGAGPLLDLGTGDVLADDVHDVARDAASSTTGILDADGLTVLDGDGEEQLAMSVRDGTTLEAVVGVLVYLRDGSAVRVHNGITGGIAQAYPQDGAGAVAVPHLVTEAGTGTLTAGSRTLLTTQRVVEEQD